MPEAPVAGGEPRAERGAAPARDPVRPSVVLAKTLDDNFCTSQAHEHVQVLQAEGGLGRRPQTPKVNLAADFAAAATARAKLDQANTALRQRVEAMQEEMDELRQELEDARAATSVGAT
jgi:DNA-binding transcriptional regulator LsrR (DeoR family)